MDWQVILYDNQGWTYTCVYEPLGLDKLDFVVKFSLLEMPLYYGGAISSKTLQFIKADRTTIDNLRLSNPQSIIYLSATHIPTNTAFVFVVDWDTFRIDDNFVEVGLKTTSLRDKFKSLNLKETDLSSIGTSYNLKCRPRIYSTINFPDTSFDYIATNRGGQGDFVIAEVGGLSGKTILDYGLCDEDVIGFKILPETNGVKKKVLEYQCYDLINTNINTHTTDIGGYIYIRYDQSQAINPDPHNYVTDPKLLTQFYQVVELVLDDGSRMPINALQEIYSLTTYIQYDPNTTTIQPVKSFRVIEGYDVQSYIPAGRTAQYLNIYITMEIIAQATSIQQLDVSKFIVSGFLNIDSRPYEMNRGIYGVKLSDLFTFANTLGCAFDNPSNLPLAIVTDTAYANGGTGAIPNLSIVDVMHNISLFYGLIFYEDTTIKRATIKTFLQLARLNAISINHHYVDNVSAHEWFNKIRAGQNAEKSNGFYAKMLWGERLYNLDNMTYPLIDNVYDLSPKMITNGSQVFANIFNQKDATMMLSIDDADNDILVYQDLYINENYATIRYLTRLLSYVYSVTSTTDALKPQTNYRAYSSFLPDYDAGSVSINDGISFNALTDANLERYGIYTKNIPLTIPQIKQLLTGVHSLLIDGSYYLPIELTISLKADTYSVSMLKLNVP